MVITPMTPTPTSPAQIEDRVIQLHRDIAAIIRRKVGMLDPFANQLAAAILEGLREDFGGGSIGGRSGVYIPAPDKSSRNSSVRAELNSTNMDAVCKKYNISVATVYRIVGREKTKTGN